MEQVLSTVYLAFLRALDLLNSNVKNKGGEKTADGEETILPPARCRRFRRLKNILTFMCIALNDVTFTAQGKLVGHQSFHAHLGSPDSEKRRALCVIWHNWSAGMDARCADAHFSSETVAVAIGPSG